MFSLTILTRQFLSKITRIVASILLAIFSLSCGQPDAYVYNEGPVYGTYYNIVYESKGGKDLHTEIKQLFADYDLSFSTFNPLSTISKINQNERVVLDPWFTNCYLRSVEISELTGGAFDITVAPLVNAWGFGFSKKDRITPELIDSLLSLTGYRKVKLENGRIKKEHPSIMLDMSAIAKGYATDLIAGFLADQGCENYMVEIGGEVVARGKNAKGNTWSIGISKPDESGLLAEQELQAILRLDGKALATSGNYRNFYEEDGQRYAHTIDPSTGYPTQHNLLSATVIANDCMTADALATAFMVLGLERSVALCKSLQDIDVYLIYSDSNGFNTIYLSDGFPKYLVE